MRQLLFPAMGLVSMGLLLFACSALLIVVTMILQAVAANVFTDNRVFRMMGSEYDAAIIVGGFLGCGMGLPPLPLLILMPQFKYLVLH